MSDKDEDKGVPVLGPDASPFSITKEHDGTFKYWYDASYPHQRQVEELPAEVWRDLLAAHRLDTPLLLTDILMHVDAKKLAEWINNLRNR